MKGDHATRTSLWLSLQQEPDTYATHTAEMVQHLQALQKENQALKARVEQVSQFARAAAHDLKEPLRMIVSYSTLLQRSLSEHADARAVDFLKEISSSAQRAYTLIDSMLEYAALSYREIALGPVDLNVVFRQVTANLKLRIEARAARLDIPALPTVYSNADLLVQVFQNLLSNALKFTPPERRPHIRVRCADEDSTCRVEVTDNGMGIPSEYLGRIFEAFERGIHGREVEGTGLGLAIVWRILDRLGGTIEVHSELGKGTTFTVVLPKKAMRA